MEKHKKHEAGGTVQASEVVIQSDCNGLPQENHFGSRILEFMIIMRMKYIG